MKNYPTWRIILHEEIEDSSKTAEFWEQASKLKETYNSSNKWVWEQASNSREDSTENYSFESKNQNTNYFNAYLITRISPRIRSTHGSRLPHCIHRRHSQHICHTPATPQIRSAQTENSAISNYHHTTKERTRGLKHETHTKESSKKIKEAN